MDYCKPFYVFREYAYINDITENDYRASKGLCQREDAQYSDKTLIDVWDLVDGDLSTVGIKGKNIMREDLRKSVSIRDRFKMDEPSYLCNLFNKAKIGLGSKHIYVPGDFMAPHRDARLPDINGMPHSMTLVVFSRDLPYMGGELLINGINPLNVLQDPGAANPMVLFPINQMHEVTKVTFGIRHVFVFPVYGELNIFNQLVNRRSYKPVLIYSEIINDLNTLIQGNPFNDEFCGELLGKLETLENERLCEEFVKYRNIRGEYVPTERSHDVPDDYSDSCDDHEEYDLHNIISYCVDGEQVVKTTSDTFHLPEQATNITVTPVKELSQNKYDANARLKYILGKVQDMQQSYLDNIAINRELAIKQKSNIESLPKEAFIYVAKNLYYSDANENALVGIDAHIYHLASKNRTTVVNFMRDIYKYAQSTSPIDIYIESDGALKKLTTSDLLPTSKYIDNLYAEHDDQGGYDCEYDIFHCCIVVDHA